EAHRTDHAHRVFAVALLRVADQTQGAVLDVAQAVGEVMQAEITDVVVQRIAGEVAPQGVFLNGAVDIVAQDLAAGAAAAVAVILVLFLAGDGAESGHFDHFALEAYVHQPEATTDDAGAAEDTFDLL